MVSLYFLLCNLVITVFLGVLLLCKKIFKKHITVNSQYYLWYVFVCALVLPFLPCKSINPSHLLLKIQHLFHEQTVDTVSSSAQHLSNAALPSQLGLSDWADAYNSWFSSEANNILTVIWLLGCFAAILYFLFNIYKIYILKKFAYLISGENEPDLYGQFVSCMKELKIKRRVSLYASCSISSPVSYGLLHPKIMIPQDMDILLSKEDVRFIFLHELQHYKHKDAALNYLTCILQIVYWFNPFIWYGFQILKKDREIACDHSVLHVVGKDLSMNYGYTLIRYAEKMQRNALLSPLSYLGGRKKVIVQRIKEIADYKTDTPRQKAKSIGLLLLICMLAACISPFLTVYASQNTDYHFSARNIEDIDLSSYFHGIDGTFVLYNMSREHYQIYNQNLSTKRVSPDSTFKIYSSLFALEEGLISRSSSLQKWNGADYPFDSWNKDQTLSTAMENSVNWYFQNLDAQLGYAKLSSYYSRIAYGNCNLSGGIKHYWGESSLKISPAEQVILLSDLLQNKWNFEEENIQTVKDALFLSDTSIGKLYGKTGSGSADGQKTNGWFIGFVEKNDQIYCFATNLQNSKNADGSTASKITMDILNTIL